MKGRVLDKEEQTEIADNPKIGAGTLDGYIEKYRRNFRNTINATDFDSWPLELLTLYIEKECHRYLKEQIPVLYTALRQVRRKEAGSDRKVGKIRILFTQIAMSLSAHMIIEENKIFPFIKSLARECAGEVFDEQSRQALAQLFQLNRDHEHMLDLFSKIQGYSNNYIPCSCSEDEYEKIFALLKSFHEDLYFHIQLETDILFPKALRQYEQYKDAALARAQAPPRR